MKQPSNLWDNVEGNKKATRDVRDLFDGKKVFDFEKLWKGITFNYTSTDTPDFAVTPTANV